MQETEYLEQSNKDSIIAVQLSGAYHGSMFLMTERLLQFC